MTAPFGVAGAVEAMLRLVARQFFKDETYLVVLQTLQKEFRREERKAYPLVSIENGELGQ